MARPFRPGPITPQQASYLNQLWESVQLLNRLGVAPPLTITTSGGSPFIGLNSGSLGGGSGITVEDYTGSPTYPDISTIQTQYVTITNPSTGVALLVPDFASGSVPGIVSTTTQSFAGAKTFENDTKIKSILTLEENLTLGRTTWTASSGQANNLGHYGVYNLLTAGTTSDLLLWGTLSGGASGKIFLANAAANALIFFTGDVGLSTGQTWVRQYREDSSDLSSFSSAKALTWDYVNNSGTVSAIAHLIPQLVSSLSTLPGGFAKSGTIMSRGKVFAVSGYQTASGTTIYDGVTGTGYTSVDVVNGLVTGGSTGGGGAPTNATYVTLSTNATLTDERVLTAGSGISITDGGAGGNVTISATGTGAPTNAQYVTLALDGTLTNERVLTAGTNITITDAGAGGNVTIASTAVQVPIGGVILWTTGTAPTNFQLCDGSAISRTTYATLFALVGTTWGAGDGSTTFNVPDLRGRAPIGAGTGSGLSARTLAATTGNETVALTSANNGPHTHTTGQALNVPAPGPAGFGGGGFALTITTSSSGSGTPHENMQPSLVMNFVIRVS